MNKLQQEEVSLPVALKEIPTETVKLEEVSAPVQEPDMRDVAEAIEQPSESVEESEPVARSLPPKVKKYKKDVEVGE